MNELNGPDKWVMKGQTAIKHSILEHYLKAYATILWRGNTTGLRTSLHYIDGFAGRGSYLGSATFEEGMPGSPIIAMGVADMIHNDTGGAASFKIHAIEMDDENFASLEGAVHSAKAEHPGASVDLRHGSFLNHIEPIVDSLGEFEHAFIFIDPFGYKDAIDLELIARLIARDRTEVFITFMSHNINRYVRDKTKTKNATMSRIFSSQKLKEVQERKDRQEVLARLYGEVVQEQAAALGAPNVLVYSTGVKYEEMDQNIYHLIHLSRSPKARFEMERAVRSSKLLTGAPPFILVWSQAEIEQLVLTYLSRRPGKRAKALDVAGAMWQTFWELDWMDNVRSVLAGMEASGKIAITRNGIPLSARMKLKESDLIQLRA